MPKRNISFTKPPEPSFIKKMKEQIGYQEPATVETKKQIRPLDNDDHSEDDEKPVVVVLKPGDLTEEEFAKEISSLPDENKRILFSKPIKKEEKNSLDFSTRRNELEKKIDASNNKRKKIKNSSLLSFDHDDDGGGSDEDDD